jgi:methionyl-tRNA synthetase
MSDMLIGYDADFLEYRIVERHDGDLANSIGNLLNRTLTMAMRYGSSRLRRGKNRSDLNWLQIQIKAYRDLAEDVFMSGTMDTVVRMAYDVNATIEKNAPWKMAKEGNTQQAIEVLYNAAETLRIIAILLSPVVPRAAHGIFDQLNWKMELSSKEERFSLADAEWGKLPDGHVVGKPVPLFPRIEG